MKHKRRWSWTVNNLRKSRTFRHKVNFSSAPAWLVKDYKTRETRECQKHLRLFLDTGKEFLYVSPRTGRMQAKWEWD